MLRIQRFRTASGSKATNFDKQVTFLVQESVWNACCALKYISVILTAYNTVLNVIFSWKTFFVGKNWYKIYSE
jgi:hypothetical protein